MRRDRASQITISGKADIDGRGYGSVTLSCAYVANLPRKRTGAGWFLDNCYTDNRRRRLERKPGCWSRSQAHRTQAKEATIGKAADYSLCP